MSLNRRLGLARWVYSRNIVDIPTRPWEQLDMHANATWHRFRQSFIRLVGKPARASHWQFFTAIGNLVQLSTTSPPELFKCPLLLARAYFVRCSLWKGRALQNMMMEAKLSTTPDRVPLLYRSLAISRGSRA
jgi:hypothetical protein